MRLAAARLFGLHLGRAGVSTEAQALHVLELAHTARALVRTPVAFQSELKLASQHGDDVLEVVRMCDALPSEQYHEV